MSIYFFYELLYYFNLCLYNIYICFFQTLLSLKSYLVASRHFLFLFCSPAYGEAFVCKLSIARAQPPPHFGPPGRIFCATSYDVIWFLCLLFFCFLGCLACCLRPAHRFGFHNLFLFSFVSSPLYLLFLLWIGLSLKNSPELIP